MEDGIQTVDAGSAPIEDANSTIPTESAEQHAPQRDVLEQLQPINDGQPSYGTYVMEDTVAEEPVQEETIPAKEDPSRHEYWQSQADKVTSENAQLKEQMSKMQETFGPIANVIEKNPQVLDNIESLSNGQTAQISNEQTSLQRPIRPQKPHTYNQVDAYNDPDSESFKYRASLDDYRDNMLEYQERLDDQRRIYAEQQQRMQFEQMQQQNAYSHAQQSWGFDPNQARDFVTWAQNPDNITLDSLGKLYQLAKAPNKQDAQVQNRVVQMKEQEQRMQAPRTTTVKPGKAAPTLNDEQGFSAGLLRHRRR